MDTLQAYYNNMSVAELNLMHVESLMVAFERSGITFNINDGKIVSLAADDE